MVDRYHRQTLLPQIGKAGQARLAASRVVLIGCGALGTTVADQLTRAGVGHLTIIDRDIVEETNLQRQVLFDEQDTRDELPKAVAAANRLREVNSQIQIESVVADVHSGNIEILLFGSDGATKRRSDEGKEEGAHVGPQLIIDGADNAETRYLVNDVSVKHNIPWIYGACVGMTGRAMPIIPGSGPCLRCLFPTPPDVGELPTCDTAGIFSPVASIVASLQAAAAIRLLVGAEVHPHLATLDLWDDRLRTTSTADARRADCPCCGKRQFEYLDRRSNGSTTSLCGRDSIQVRPPAAGLRLNLTQMATKFAEAGKVEQTPYLIRCQLDSPAGIKLTLFEDGRLIVQGVRDPERARALYARYIGM